MVGPGSKDGGKLARRRSGGGEPDERVVVLAFIEARVLTGSRVGPVLAVLYGVLVLRALWGTLTSTGSGGWAQALVAAALAMVGSALVSGTLQVGPWTYRALRAGPSGLGSAFPWVLGTWAPVILREGPHIDWREGGATLAGFAVNLAGAWWSRAILLAAPGMGHVARPLWEEQLVCVGLAALCAFACGPVLAWYATVSPWLWVRGRVRLRAWNPWYWEYVPAAVEGGGGSPELAG